MREAEGTAEDDWEDSAESSSQSPFEKTYRGLMRALYEGQFIPGQRLIAPDLMRYFGVGRGTIREVLNRLASSGVVTIIPNRGAQVRELSRREVGDVLEIVEVLLGLAARGAAAAIKTRGAGVRLRELHDALRPDAASGEAFPQFLRAREDYYRYIVQLSGNQELQRLFPGAQVHIMRVQLRNFGRAADAAHVDDFTELTEAILSGDAEGAEAAGRRHVGYTKQRVAQLPDRAFARDG